MQTTVRNVALGIAILAILIAIALFITWLRLSLQLTAPTPMAALPETNPQTTQVPVISNIKALAKLVVPGNNNQGLTYQIPESGVYTFEYSDSAVSGWPSGAWTTSVNCFRGDKVIWVSTSLGDSPTLFDIGNFATYATKDEAMKASRGTKAVVNLEAGEQITCVAPDGKNDFLDNSGEIIIDVSVSVSP